MNWFSKHADSIAVIATISGAVIWMNGRFNALEKDVTIIKNVLIMKNILPAELAKLPTKEES